MSNHEGNIIKQVQIQATAKGWRLFRNSVGQGWQGKKASVIGRDGEIVQLSGARRVKFGLALGSSDLVGWRPVVITPDMVGKTVAQFVSVECKTREYSKTTPDQDNWLDQVAESGGAAYIARPDGDGISLDQIEK